MSDEQIIQKINDILEHIRPSIKMDGGDIELISFQNGIVSIELFGACVGCPLSFYTIKLVIEEQLKESIPDVKEVIAVN